jgi:hypothetical protein
LLSDRLVVTERYVKDDFKLPVKGKPTSYVRADCAFVPGSAAAGRNPSFLLLATVLDFFARPIGSGSPELVFCFATASGQRSRKA